MSFTPILCLDFDGVCHSYTSGWQGADVIPDPPVSGLFMFLNKAREHFDIQIFSSRSHQPGGRTAMQSWFLRHTPVRHEPDDFTGWYKEWVMRAQTFPMDKPSAMITLDDRGLLFTGVWPSIEELKAFQPWNKRG